MAFVALIPGAIVGFIVQKAMKGAQPDSPETTQLIADVEKALR